MEFLRHEPAMTLLSRHGVVERADGDTVSLRPADHAGGLRVVLGPTPPRDDPATVYAHVVVPLDQLGNTLERLLQRLHTGEVLVCPSSPWRSILDLALFVLAQDDAWLEVDADATMHQNTRDPLLVPPKARHIVGTLVASLMGGSGRSPAHDCSIAAVDEPLLVTVTAGESVTLWCLSAAAAEVLISKLGAS